MDYYKILEIDKTADDNTIKKAYRRLAAKWHPDKNINNKELAEKKFKEINEAHETLKDNNKRHMYNMGRSMTPSHVNPGQNKHFFDLRPQFGGTSINLDLGSMFGNMSSVSTHTFFQNGRVIKKRVTTKIVNGKKSVIEEIIM
tara:strand:- start:4383 stop:4811 length:429 start_codon:yes stop_codon:yes gene_type:complete